MKSVGGKIGNQKDAVDPHNFTVSFETSDH